MTLALTGGTGFVGQAVLDVTGKNGLPARALARSKPTPRKEVSWLEGSLSDKDSLFRLVDGAHAVLHIAGLTTARDISEFEAANVVGTLNLVEACKAANTSRLIFVSSLAAREPDLSAYGSSKARAEKLVAASGLDWTIVRPPAVYGPRDKDMLDLFRMARRGIVPVPAAGAASLIYVRDLAHLLLALLDGDEGISFEVFEPDDGHAGGWSHRELAMAIGRAVGTRPWVPQLSRRALGWASRLDCFFRRDKAKLTPDRVSYMSHPDWVVSQSARVPPSIWQPKVATDDGLKATARWYRRKGWL